MFDPTRLLGAMLEARGAASTPQRLDAAFQQAGQAGPANPFQGILASLGGAAGGGAAGGAGALLGQIGDMAQRAFGQTAQEVKSNNPVAVGGLGALAGALLGGGRGAVGGGLLAALGSIAYQALQQSGQAAPAPDHGSEAALHGHALLLLRAMIEAAKADGQVDPQEAGRILDQLHNAGIEAEGRAWVESQLAAPSDLAALARDAQGPTERAQIYGAALMAIEVDTPEERDFLARLRSALELSPLTVAEIHRSLGVPL